jgi:hypothetical protein
MTTNMKNIFAIMATVLCALSATAQVDKEINYDAELEGNRRLYLRDANKISVVPQTKDSVMQMTTIQYTTIPTPKTVTIDPKPIPAAKINVDEKLGYLYRGYIKAGYGTYNTLPIDFYYTDGRSKKGSYGVHYQLLRGDGVALDDKDSIPDRYSDNRAEVWGKWFMKRTQLLGSVNWERNVNHWYGLDLKNNYEGPRLDSMDFKQRMNTFGGSVSYLTYQRDTGEFNFEGKMGIRGSKDIYNNKENNFDLLLHGRTLKDNTLYSMDVGFNYNSFSYFGPDMLGNGRVDDPTFKDRNWDNMVLKFIPTASTTWKGLRAKVGAGIYIEGRGSSPGHFYPLAEASYNLFDGVVVPYVGVRGSTEPTTYLSLYRENPFIQTFPDLKNLNNKLDVYGGIGGSISHTVSYSVGVNYYEWGNFHYFVNDSIKSPQNNYYTHGNVFTVMYDDLTALNFHGELALFNGQKWKANIRGDYFNYTTGREDHAWHQPALKFLANGQYNIRNKFIIGTDLFYMGARWAKSNIAVHGVTKAEDGSYHYKLKGFLDMNFKVEYRYNKRLSAWVQFNNALALKYQRYSAYPTQQFLAMMGAAYSF